MKSTIKSNLSILNNQLSVVEMQEIQGGKVQKAEFCAGFTAAGLIYGAGILLNQWNPLGWAADAVLLAGSAYCL